MSKPQAEWIVGLGIRVEMATGAVNSWSEELHVIADDEDEARGAAEGQLDDRLRGDWPGFRSIEVEALASRLAVKP